jgi:PAS domain S-box-containing protein
VIGAPLPPDEEERLEALKRADILDTPPEQAFDDLTRLAAKLCGTPIALVALVDRDRQWFKSKIGISIAQTPREQSFCAHAILGNDPFHIADAAADARFADHPWVTGDPNIRLYAAVPLFTRDQHKLGTLCVLDRVARPLSAEQVDTLSVLARQVAAQIDLRASAGNLRRTNAALTFAVREARAAKEQLDDLLDNASDLIQSLGADGRILYANRAWREALGYTAAEISKMRFEQVIAPEDLKRMNKMWAALTRGEPLGLVEATLLRKDGGRVIVEGGATCRFVDGKPMAVRSIFRDITARKHHEERFLRYADVVEAMQIGLLVWRPELSAEPSTFRLLATNRAARELLGITEHHLNATYHQIAALLAATPAIDAYFQALDSGEVVVVRDLDHKNRVFNASIFRLPGPLIGVAFDDVTGQKAVDRLKDEFVSTVSHELRTPLTSIRGALGLLEAGVLGALPTDALEVVRIARSNTDRLVRLINDILDLEKIEAGKLELKTSTFTPAGLVAATARMLQGVAEEARVALHTDVADLDAIEGDEDRLVQVLTNLVSNAIKFSEPGDVVTIRAQQVSNARVRFSVEDQGEGIAEQDIPKLFGKFQQLDASDKRRRGGTGLGLSISKAIVEDHGGAIGVTSAHGRGSTFWFELPNVERPSLPSISPGGSSVLLVTDDLACAMKLGSLLVQEGYTVERASSLCDAEQLIETGMPRAAVVASQLPDGDGVAFLRKLRARRGLRNLPVIFVGSLAPPPGVFADRFVVGHEGERIDPRRFTATLRWALRARTLPRTLVIEDDASARAVVVRQLTALGFECLQAANGVDGIRLARASAPDLIVLDARLPGLDGYGVVETLRTEASRDTPLLMYTALDLSPTERRALTLGPTRFVTKSRSSEGDFVAAARELLATLSPTWPPTPPPPPAPPSLKYR